MAARPGGVDLMASWQEVPDAPGNKTPFRQCWEAFLRHVAEDAPYLPTLVEGAKAVQLADLAYRSTAEQRWMNVPELKFDSARWGQDPRIGETPPTCRRTTRP